MDTTVACRSCICTAHYRFIFIVFSYQVRRCLYLNRILTLIVTMACQNHEVVDSHRLGGRHARLG